MPRPDLIEAKRRLVAKPPKATKIGPQPQPSVWDKALHTLTGVANPRTQPFAERTGPADVVIAGLGLGGAAKGLSRLGQLAEEAVQTSPAKVMGAYRGLNSTRELSPELKMLTESIASSPSKYAQDALNKVVVPKLLDNAFGGVYGRRGFLQRAAGAPGRVREIKALQKAPNLWQDIELGSDFVTADDAAWHQLLRDNKTLVNMMGGVKASPVVRGQEGLDSTGTNWFFKGAPSVTDEASYALWERADQTADTALAEMAEIMQNPSIIGQRIRRILGLDTHRVLESADKGLLGPVRQQLGSLDTSLPRIYSTKPEPVLKEF